MPNDNVKIELVDVTPGLAAKWLENNKNNRNIRDQHVDTLARDMRVGNWKFNGDAVRFDDAGNLIDGQHRLWAIMHSGTTQKMLVVRGLSEEAFDTIDSGALRTAGDALSRRGFHMGTNIAATVRILKWYEMGRDEWNVVRRMSHSEIVHFALEHEGIQIAVDRIKYSPQLKKLSAGAPLCAVAYLGYKHDPDLTEHFLVGVEGGEGLEDGDARKTYRDWLINKHQQSIRYQMPSEFSITARAFNAYAVDKPVKLFRFDQKAEAPELILLGPKPPGPARVVPKNSELERLNGRKALKAGAGTMRMAR